MGIGEFARSILSGIPRFLRRGQLPEGKEAMRAACARVATNLREPPCTLEELRGLLMAEYIELTGCRGKKKLARAYRATEDHARVMMSIWER